MGSFENQHPIRRAGGRRSTFAEISNGVASLSPGLPVGGLPWVNNIIFHPTFSNEARRAQASISVFCHSKRFTLLDCLKETESHHFNKDGDAELPVNLKS